MPEKIENILILRRNRLCTNSSPNKSAMRCKTKSAHFLTIQFNIDGTEHEPTTSIILSSVIKSSTVFGDGHSLSLGQQKLNHHPRCKRNDFDTWLKESEAWAQEFDDLLQQVPSQKPLQAFSKLVSWPSSPFWVAWSSVTLDQSKWSAHSKWSARKRSTHP